MAARANREGKILAEVDGELVLQGPPPLTSNELIKTKIEALEATQTERMKREAALGVPDGKALLQSIEDEISALRNELHELTK